MNDKKRINLIKKLNELEYDILNNAYIEDDDGEGEDGKPILLPVYIGLNEKEIKSLLAKIGAIIELIKEEDYDKN